jgi:hypothetical protein
MMAFAKDSWQRAMMGDFYHLAEKYWVVPADKRHDDDFWDELIKDTDDFCRKYARDDDRFATEIVLVIIQHAEDQARGKGTLCDFHADHPMEAVMRFAFRKEAERCRNTSQKTDAGMSG